MVVTPLYAALLALWLLLLSARVGQCRRRAGVSLGDGGDPALQRAIRGQGNFVEYVPLALVLLAVLEMSRFSIYLLHILGIMLLVGRLLHGYALSYTSNWRFGRFWGTVLTFVMIAFSAVLCLYQAYRAHIVWFAPA
jgi:uncharacterized protein